ncbi:hypothetical protein OS493_005410 [Desmophyllum pertusum]|uniref:Uncharacterized protein n=1 Tax=Desmophyllum pertusum TaxID=174260 RepID=A0A9X0CMF4_9CNID|nr:hypothetical protein OS493_005410 [Desmophyllum pertusum]
MRHRQGVEHDNISDVDFMYYDPGVVQTDGTVGLTSVSVQTDEKLLKPSSGPPSSRGQAELINGLYNLRGVTSDGHLPILNALLQELSCLTGGQRSTDTAQPRSVSGRSQTTPRHPQTVSARKLPPDDTSLRKVTKSETYKKQTHPPKSTQTAVIGLPRQRVHFKQTSLTYGMTRTQKMRLEINQKDKLLNRTRPCEVQGALTKKENIKRDSLQTPLSKAVDHRTTTPEKHGLPGTTDMVKENTAKPDAEVIDSARSLKSANSLEVFIPRVEGEPDEKSDQDREWTTDQPPTGFYGNTGITSAELDDIRGGSAMTMYTEDFENSGTEGSQASYHLAFTRSNSVDNENLKQRSNPDDSSATKSRKSKAKIEVTAGVERKITTSERDFEMSADQASRLAGSSSGASNDQKEASEGSYSEDFQSVGSEPEVRHSDATSDDSVDESDDIDHHGKLDLPPPASNLGYTY